jgi:NAD(P)-dependent dehydrogenase (short-subunit alcohol dehydrogenase family)
MARLLTERLRVALLEKKVCVVSGAAGSIGIATVRLMLREGAKVMMLDLKGEELKRAAKDLPPEATMTAVCDVANASQVKAAFDATVERWGKLDVIFSNAGNQGSISALADASEDEFDLTLAIHARGAFLACKYGPPLMASGGSIIITSSVAGVRGGGGTNTAYVAAKHAQVGIMRSAARALAARNIRVNTINPGAVDNAFQTGIELQQSKILGINVTEQLNQAVPLKRHAHADEIAGAVLFLASDLSSYDTGHVLMVDGGLMS